MHTVRSVRGKKILDRSRGLLVIRPQRVLGFSCALPSCALVICPQRVFRVLGFSCAGREVTMRVIVIVTVI